MNLQGIKTGSDCDHSAEILTAQLRQWRDTSNYSGLRRPPIGEWHDRGNTEGKKYSHYRRDFVWSAEILLTRFVVFFAVCVAHYFLFLLVPWPNIKTAKPSQEAIVEFYFFSSEEKTAPLLPTIQTIGAEKVQQALDSPSYQAQKRLGQLRPVIKLKNIAIEPEQAIEFIVEKNPTKNQISLKQFSPTDSRRTKKAIFKLDGSVANISQETDSFALEEIPMPEIRLIGKPPSSAMAFLDKTPHLEYKTTIFNEMWAPDQENLLDEVVRKKTKEFTLKTKWGTKIKCAVGLATLGIVICAW